LLGNGWSQLLTRGMVEMLDLEEEQTVMIAMTPEDLELSQAKRRTGNANDGPSNTTSS
jgi:DNA-directed RNA polymerase II subunit RPB2